ncbi:MAG: hypothetical protein JWR59_2255 [Brevundimonas sp.]|nr:hypothetical protein [Brevundimonas sp.]
MPLPAPDPATVFIIDNDLAVLSALAFAFEAEGFKVCAFRNTARADRSANLDTAACIVLEHELPEECGLDYLARLRREGRARPAVLILNAPTSHLCRAAQAMGVPIVEKPLLDDTLFQTVRTLVDKHRALAKP